MSSVDHTPDVIAAVALGVHITTFVITVLKGRKGWAILGLIVPMQRPQGTPDAREWQPMTVNGRCRP